MKIMKLVILIVMIAVALFLILPNLSWAQDTATVYKTKCAACHGAEGQGKIGPAVKGISLSTEQITDLLTKGGEAKKAPHKKAIAGLSADDAKAVAEYVKTLK